MTNREVGMGTDYNTEALVVNAKAALKKELKTNIAAAQTALNKALVAEQVQEVKLKEEILKLEEASADVETAKAALKEAKKAFRHFKSAPKKKAALAAVGTVATMAAAAVVANRLGLLGDDEK